MTHPHTGPGPATPPAGARRGSVPGPADLGVPVTIWPGLPVPAAGHSPAACPGPVTAAAAARAITAFSRPGDLIAAPDGSPAVIEAAAAAGLRILGLIPAGEHAVTGLPASAAPAARLRPGGPGALLAPDDPDAGQAALAITGCHGAGCCCPEPGGADDPVLVYAACQRVLAPGGVLAVITASRAEGGQLADLAGSTPSTSSWSTPPSTATTSPPAPPPPLPAAGPAAPRFIPTCWSSPSHRSPPA
jgi:hypothetical protein